jgi:hypothetical protein
LQGISTGTQTLVGEVVERVSPAAPTIQDKMALLGLRCRLYQALQILK